eukprot:scaffold111469_cov35-Tisochrysis_lutea.AAC.3
MALMPPSSSRTWPTSSRTRRSRCCSKGTSQYGKLGTDAHSPCGPPPVSASAERRTVQKRCRGGSVTMAHVFA